MSDDKFGLSFFFVGVLGLFNNSHCFLVKSLPSFPVVTQHFLFFMLLSRAVIEVKTSDLMLLLFFQARFLVPVQESSQGRRVVVSHNVDKALKEGNGPPFCFEIF